MSEQIREQISALLDGELPMAEQPLLLERLARDPALRAVWVRYRLIGDGLRKHLPDHVDLALAERVMGAIETLPAQATGVPFAVRRAFKPLVGLAVAASVAVIAVLAVQQARVPAPGAAQVAANLPAQSARPVADAYRRVQGAPWETQPGEAQPGTIQPPQVGRLNEYIVNHSAYAASGGMLGMQPYVRIVGYDQE